MLETIIMFLVVFISAAIIIVAIAALIIMYQLPGETKGDLYGQK